MKITTVLPVFIIAVAFIVAFGIKERVFLEAGRSEFTKLNLIEILLRDKKLSGQYIETVGFISVRSSDLFHLFVDEKRAQIYDFESSIAIVGENKEIHSHIQSSCLNSWVTIRGKMLENTSPFYTEEFIFLVSEILTREDVIKDTTKCEFHVTKSSAI